MPFVHAADTEQVLDAYAGAFVASPHGIPSRFRNGAHEFFEQLDWFRREDCERLPEELAWARRECPVVPSGFDGGQYVVTRYDDLRTVGEHPEIFSSTTPGVQHVPVALPPLDLDPPLHRDFRQFLNPYFSRSFLSRYLPRMRELADSLIDGVIDRGRLEFVSEFAIPFTAGSLARVVIDDDDPDRMERAVQAVTGVATGDPSAFERVAGAAAEILSERSAGPAGHDDVLQSLITARVGEGRPLTLDEQLGVVTVLLLGGLDTTRGAIAHIGRFLAQLPGFEQRLRRPEWVRRDLEEILRHASTVSVMGRTVVEATQMQAVVVPKVNARWELQSVGRPEAGPNQVLVRVHACAICGTDVWMANGTLSFREFPLVLGHEGVGEVVAVGAGVTQRKIGDRVGIPMVQKRCGKCDFCREQHPNSFVTAANCAAPILTGVNVDGAHAEYIAADVDGTVLLPDAVPYELAAPTLCAGFTVWAGLRRAEVKPSGRVAVVGIGGLGHLAIQYAKAAGYHVTAVTHSLGKRDLARQLGADEVVTDGAGLKAAGGADLIMHTSSNHAAVAGAMEGLRPWGKVVMMGIATDEMTLPALPLVSHSYQIIGSAHNGFEYLAEALDFVARGAVTPMIEVFTKERVAEAYEKAANGDIRFKAVVTY